MHGGCIETDCQQNQCLPISMNENLKPCPLEYNSYRGRNSIRFYFLVTNWLIKRALPCNQVLAERDVILYIIGAEPYLVISTSTLSVRIYVCHGPARY